jgi:hypothetical protein
MIPKATRPLDGHHSQKIPEAGPDDGDVRLEGVRVNDGGDGIGGVVESVNEFEAQGDQQRDGKQNVGSDGTGVHSRQIGEKMEGGINYADQQDNGESDYADHSGAFAEFLLDCRRGRRHSRVLLFYGPQN